MQAIVEAVEGPGKGRRFTLKVGDVFVVGRTEWSDICIGTDQQLSARHFAVESGGAGLRLVDQGSTNGTQVNGEFVKEAPLGDGDTIVAGTTTFRVKVEAAAPGNAIGGAPFSAETPGTAAEPGTPIGLGGATPPSTPPYYENPSTGAGQAVPPGSGPISWAEAPTSNENPIPPSPISPSSSDSPFESPPSAPNSVGQPMPLGGGSPFDPPGTPVDSTPVGSSSADVSPMGGAPIGGAPISGTPISADSNDSPFELPGGPNSPAAAGSISAFEDSSPASPTPFEELPSSSTDDNPFVGGPSRPVPDESGTADTYQEPGSSIPYSEPATDRAVPDEAPTSLPPAYESPTAMPGPTQDASVLGAPPSASSSSSDAISPISDAAGQRSDPDSGMIKDNARNIKAATPEMLQYSIIPCKSEKLVCMRANYGDAQVDFQPSSLMYLLKRHLPLVVIAHFQKGGLEYPEDLTEATPLLHWLPDETARNFGPVMIPPTQQLDRFATVDELWDKDAVLGFYASDIHGAMDHLSNLLKRNVNGPKEEEGIFGYCWPSVINNLLEHQQEDVVDMLLGGVIDCLFVEVSGQAGHWQLFGTQNHVEMLNQTGFRQVAAESGTEAS